MARPLEGATLPSIQHADGSASYSNNGFTIVATVNGPIEVQRRDELPEEAVVDVVVRPVATFGGIREKYLGTIVQNVLRHIILVSAHPRTLIQITLQVVSSQEHHWVSDLASLPALFHASVLALVASSVPLSSVLTSASVAIDNYGTQVCDPSAQQAQAAASLHVFCFSSLGDLLLDQSAGLFSIEAWGRALELAKARCRGKHAALSEPEGDIIMDSIETPNLENSLRATVQKQVLEQQRWKFDRI